jgi:hypothetical protein
VTPAGAVQVVDPTVVNDTTVEFIVGRLADVPTGSVKFAVSLTVKLCSVAIF